jgi:predicted RNase H-like HicB family nuclease
MLDFCARLGSPPNELYQMMYKNLAEIIWYGSQGYLIDPLYEHKYGVEVFIHSSWADQNWQEVEFPSKYRENIKLRNACKFNGKYYAVPQTVGLPEVGAIVAEGDTIKETIDKIKEIADTVKGYYLEIKLDAIDTAMGQFKELEQYGVKIL